MYGLRKAASERGNHYSKLLEDVGVVGLISSGVVFHHRVKDISSAVHGDEFAFCGLGSELTWTRGLMHKWFEVKVRGVLGTEEGDDKEVSILGRWVRCDEGGILYEADPRHCEKVLEHFGFAEDSEGTVVNGDKEHRVEEWEKEE